MGLYCAYCSRSYFIYIIIHLGDIHISTYRPTAFVLTATEHSRIGMHHDLVKYFPIVGHLWFFP